MKGRRIGRFAVYRLRGETIVVRLGNSPVNSADPPSLTRFNGTVVNGGGRGPLKKKKKKREKQKKATSTHRNSGYPESFEAAIERRQSQVSKLETALLLLQLPYQAIVRLATIRNKR